eukprot:1156081-Pelagomonas_calceolata.AAC.21
MGLEPGGCHVRGKKHKQRRGKGKERVTQLYLPLRAAEAKTVPDTSLVYEVRDHKLQQRRMQRGLKGEDSLAPQQHVERQTIAKLKRALA